MKIQTSITGLVAALALTAGSAAMAASPGVSSDKIVFGQSAALDGPAGALGKGMREGLMAAFNEANAKGGVNGRKLELISLDDGYEPKRAIDNTKKLIGEDNVCYEVDYPHSDAPWPNAPEILWKSAQLLTDEQIDKITHLNAMRLYKFDMFKHAKREELTVGALRAKAEAAGVDTTLISTGGSAPLAEGETPRPVTSGDVVQMYQKHAETA